ncbi:MAG: hypothetical protein JW702_01075 [Clostridiales bacterium]|nr:hypothetical protein [Clostridiales bacterium]
MNGRVVGILLSVNKGQPRVNIESGEFVKGKGLKGDSYFESKVEVVMLPYASRQEIKQSHEDGLCFKRFVETLSLEMNGTILLKGDIVFIGSAKFQVVSSGKRCFPECSIVQKGRVCALATGTVYLDVIQTGRVSVGDEVMVNR